MPSVKHDATSVKKEALTAGRPAAAAAPPPSKPASGAAAPPVKPKKGLAAARQAASQRGRTGARQFGDASNPRSEAAIRERVRAEMAAEQKVSHERAHTEWQVKEGERLRQEEVAKRRQEAARQRKEAARAEISAAYREAVLEEEADDTQAAPAEPDAASAPAAAAAAPVESHSEAVARMMRERREAREATERELAGLHARQAARRASAGVGGVFAGGAGSTGGEVRIDRGLFQRPLIAEGATSSAAAAETVQRQQPGARRSTEARSAWEWAMQRDS